MPDRPHGAPANSQMSSSFHRRRLAGHLGGVQLEYAAANGLLRDDVSYEVQHAIEVRIVLAQALYAAGFALCVFSTLWSIAAIVVVQLVFAFAPTIRWLKRHSPLGGGGPSSRRLRRDFSKIGSVTKVSTSQCSGTWCGEIVVRCKLPSEPRISPPRSTPSVLAMSVCRTTAAESHAI
jgi:hypothetical protein